MIINLDEILKFDRSYLIPEKTGNSRGWEFKIFTGTNSPNWIQAIKDPINIKVKLKVFCHPDGFSGNANRYPHDWNPIQKILNQRYTVEVYTYCPKNSGPFDVYWTTLHEMHHAMGMGHAWHEIGDMMCSREPLNGRMEATCNPAVDRDNYNDNNSPSEFDVRAVIDSYGSDGFERPNKDLSRNSNDLYFWQPLPCESSNDEI